MASGRNLTVYLTSDVTRFGRGLKAAETRMETFRRRAGTIAKGVGVGVAAGAAAFTAYAVEGVQAAAAQEKANTRLARTLKNLGLDKSTDQVLDQIDAMQRLYGVSEDDLLPAFGKVVGVTKNTARAFDLLQAGLDLAAGTGKPLETVMAGIAKAAGEGGSTGALKRLAPELDTVGLKAGDTAELMKRVNKQFGGQAAAQADTLAGTTDRLGIAFGEVNEALGKGLIEGFLTSMGGGDADKALANIQEMEDDAERVGGAVATLGAGLLSFAADFIMSLDAIGTAWGNWIDDGGRKLTDIQDFLGIISDEEGQAINDYYDRRYQQRVQEFVQRNQPTPPRNPNSDYTATPYYGTADLYRYNPRKADVSGRGDGRAAQRNAKTRAQP